jgi:hypothetical protein
MKTIRYLSWMLSIVLPLVASIGNASIPNGAFDFFAPGIGSPSWPLLLGKRDTIKVKSHHVGSETYWTLTGWGSSSNFWGGPSDSIALRGERVRYQANFNSAGQLITSIGSRTLSNFLEIKGSLPAGTFGETSWPSQRNKLLLRADLLDANPDNGIPDLIGTFDGVALGFKTKFTGGWIANNTSLTGGSTGENLWLYGLSLDFQNLAKALDGIESNGTLRSLIGRSETIRNVTSIASIPLPGAAWLFVSGLMALFTSRRNHAGSSRFAM